MSEAIRDAVKSWILHRDQAASVKIIKHLHPLVMRIIHSHLPVGAAAEDWAQDVYLKLFSRLPLYDFVRPLENWVARITLNVCRDLLRARRRKPEVRWSDLDAETAAWLLNQMKVETPKDLAPQSSRRLLHQLMDTLSADDRMIVTLLHLEEKSVAEISTHTGWSRVAIRVRALRARLKLRKALQLLEQTKL